MSVQRSEKVRIGSSQQGTEVNQSKKSETDDGIHDTDRPPVAQYHMAEESIESFGDLAELNSNESGNQYRPLSDVTGKRRKLGSSRRNKGRQGVKDSIAKSYHETREEVVEIATCHEALFGNRSKSPSGTVEIESASNHALDFVEPDRVSSMKVEDTESPIQEKNSPIEHNQPKCIVESGPSHDNIEQSNFTLRTKEPLTENRNNERFKLSQATDTKLFAQLHQSEDAVNYTVAEEDIYEPTQMRELNSIHNFDGSVLHAAAENLDVACAELIEDSNVGVRETCQSEIIIKSVDQPVNEEGVIYSDKQDKDPTKQSNREVFSKINEDEYVHGFTEPRSNKIGRTDTALDKVYDNEGQMGIDREGIVKDLINLEGETLPWKSEDCASSLQTLPSCSSLCSDKCTHTSDSAGKERKMASTRRNRRRQIQKNTDERLKEEHEDADTHEDVDVGKEAVWGGGKNAEVVSENDEIGEQFGDGKKEDNMAPEIKISYEDTYSQSPPAAQNRNVLSETLDVFDISNEDLNEIVTNPEVHEPQSSWTSDADAPDKLQSQQDTLDRPEQNSDDDENPHIKSNSTGKRRKMGSSRRNLRHGHEEKNTEKMQDETSLMQLIQEKQGGMTREVNSSLERDDPIKSTERVSEDEKVKSLKGELENRSEFSRYEESEITEFHQSQTILFHKEDDSQTSDIHVNTNSRPDTLDVLNQEVSQDQNMESISGETQAVREEAYLHQTNEVKERLEDFTVADLIEIRSKHDREEEGPMNAEVVSENDEIGEQFGDGKKEDNIAPEIKISYEDTYSQSPPAAQNRNVLSETLHVFDISNEDLNEIVTNPEVHEPQPSWTSDADAPDKLQSQQDTLDRPEQNSNDDENPHIKSNSTGKRRKMGSTRRNLRHGHEEKNTEKMQDETSLMQLIQEKQGGMTREVNSSLERDDPIKSTERVSEDEKAKSLKGELENRSEFSRYEESEITEFHQSQTILFHKEDDSQTSDIHVNTNSRPDTLDVLNQEVSQNQNMESISGETQAAKEDAYLQQTNDVKEMLEDFTVTDLIEIRSKHDREEEGPMNAEVVSENDEIGEHFGDGKKEDNIAPEIDISNEDTYSQSPPAAQNRNVLSETLDVFDISNEDLNEILTNPEVHEPQPSWTSDADAPDKLQSQQDTLDRPEQNSDDDENPHIKSNSTGKRRKMGSTRRNLRQWHEEKNTEKMQDETSLMQLIQEKQGGMTREVNSSLERDDPIKPTERVSEDEKAKSLKGELENRSEFSRYEESEITEFHQSQTILFHKEDDSQTSDIHVNTNSRPDTLDVLNQEVSQDQNMESISGETQAVREEAYLHQTNEVKERLEDFTVADLIEIRSKHDREEEGPMNAEVVSENDEIGEQFGDGKKEDNIAPEIDISYEDTYSQSPPAAQNRNVLSETLDVFDISNEDLNEIVTNPEVHEPQPSWTSDADAPDTLQSQQDTLDRPEQNSDDDENPHIKSNSTGKRRKMGSTRRNLRQWHEEKNTEKMQDETSLMQLIQEKQGGMTREVNSSLERDDPIKSTERVSEDEKAKSLKGELENRSEFSRYEESEITEFHQSQTILFHKEDDSQTSDIHVNTNSRPDTLDVLNQEVSQDQNMESISGETQAVREEAYLHQTNEVKERLEDFTVADLIEIRSKHDREEEGPMNAEVVSENDEIGEQFGDGKKEDNIAPEIDISYEDTYSQSPPAAQNRNVLSETLDVFDISNEDLNEIVTNPEVHEPQPSWTSDADAPDTLQSQQDTLDRPEQNSDDYENPHIKSNSAGQRRKMGSTRRNLRHGHEEKNTEKMQDETSLMQLIQEKQGGMTREVNSSLERDDPIESTERVSEDEKAKSLKGELENRSELTRHEESEITDFLQSQIMLFHKEDDSQTSAIENVLYHDDKEKINSRTEVSQDQNIESISGETQAARDMIHMEQTYKNEVEETLVDFKESDLIETASKYDTKVEGLITTAQVVSEKDEVGEQSGDQAKEDHIAQDIYEDTYSQAIPAGENENVLSEPLDTFDFTEPAVCVFQQHSTSDTDTSDVHQSQQDTLNRPEQTKDYDVNGHVKFNSTRTRKKLGSSRRVPRSRKNYEGTDKKQEDKRVEADFNTGVDMNTQESCEDELKMLDEPKYTASDEPKPLEEITIDSAANISSASYVSTQSFNQRQNITGNLDMLHMGSNVQSTNINLSNEPMELTVEVEPFENTSNEDIGGGSLPAFKSEVIIRNNDEVTDEPKTARGRKMDSTQRNLLDSKNVEVTERLKDKREVVEKLEVTEVANVSRIEKAEKPLNPVCIPDDFMKEEVKGQQETTVAITGQYHGQDQCLKASDQLNIDLESNKKSSMADSMALLSEETGNTSHSEDVGNHALFIQHSERHDGGEIVDDPMALSLKPAQLDTVITTDMHIPTTVFESNSSPPNQLLQSSPNSEDCINTDPSIKGRRRKMGSSRRTARGAQKVEKSSEEIVVQNQEVTKKEAQEEERKSEERSDIEMSDLEIAKSEDNGGAREGDENALVDISGSLSCSNTSLMQVNNVSEGVDNTKSEIETSQQSNTTSRRRKMGSTRRNLRVKPEEENLDVRQEAGAEVSEIAKEVDDATLAEHAFDVEKIDSQLIVKLTDDDSEEQKQRLFEAGASHLIPMAHKSYLESKENPVIDAQQVDTVHHLYPSHLPSKSSPSPENVLHSKVKIEGRRRKMGSTRKSQGHHLYEDPAENEEKIKDAGMRDLESITADSVIKTSEDQRAESIGLAEKTEVDKSDKRPPSNYDSGTREHPRTADCLSQRAPGQPAGHGDQLVDERQKTQPLGYSKQFNHGTNHYNVVMVGNSNVGKTSFIKWAQNGEFCSDLSASIGIDTSVQSVTVDGKTVVLQLWDTAGQERFRSITRQVFHRAQAFLLMYDITSSQSFCDVRYWVTCIQEGAADDVSIVLLGNKSDCAKRQVYSDEAEALAKEYNIDFMECSAATGENVFQSMETVARMLSQKVKETEESMVLHKEPQRNKSFGCC